MSPEDITQLILEADRLIGSAQWVRQVVVEADLLAAKTHVYVGSAQQWKFLVNAHEEDGARLYEGLFFKGTIVLRAPTPLAEKAVLTAEYCG